MPKRIDPIPVNKFGDDIDTGISIETIFLEALPPLGDWKQPERHDRHSFFLVETGSVKMEIDFQLYDIRSPAIIYMHPDQVHRIIGFEEVTVCAWAMDNENLSEEYRKLLDDITPAAPLSLNPGQFELLKESASLCLKISRRKRDQIQHLLLRDQMNALIGLVIADMTERFKTADKLSRAESVTKSFRECLSTNFREIKRPADYAETLNLSIPYLNEFVKSATGQPVSYHIQQRVILEARRLLYHSDQSLKEIAAQLGYDDYPYFSRLFTKITGMSPIAFRSKNLD